MSINKDAEAALEKATVELFKSLQWDYIHAEQEVDGDTTLLGREHQGEVVLTRYLEPALRKLNPTLPQEAIHAAIEILIHDRSSMSIVQANGEVYQMLKNGVRVNCRDSKGNETVERVQVIDWNNPANNHFLLVSQFWVNGDPYRRRPDLVGFVNGLPMLLIELKASDKPVQNAFNENLKDYKTTIAPIFWYNAFVILSNGSQAKIGSISAPWEHFADWKKINTEGEEGVISLDTLIKGTCEKTRLMDILENFMYFSEATGGLIKIVAKNHQYLGVNNAFAALQRLATLTQTLTPTLSQREKEQALTPALSQREKEESLTQTLSQGEKEQALTQTLSQGKKGQNLDPTLSQREKEQVNYRGGFNFSGLVDRARELRRQQTPAEQILWELLRDRQFLGLKFRRQHQIGDYIADFYCHEQNLIVELDGPIHKNVDIIKRDHKRDSYLCSLGYTVLRIPNDDVLNNPEKVLKQIEAILPSPSGRRIEVEGASLPSPDGRRIEDEGAFARRLGVFWHTQGSGKSASMIFFSQKVLRKVQGNWTFLIITDRQDLDDQIYKTFVNAKIINEEGVQADSSKTLRQLLQEDHRYVFTLIHKFRTENGQKHPVLSTRSDIIVVTDEAHRTQYDILAQNMRDALPNAAFIGFTGTPLIKTEEEKTREVFGDYVSIYNFTQSIEDGATVPLYYENRIPEVQLTNDNFNKDMERLLDEAMLDDEQEKKLEREFSRQYHIITRDGRLEKIAEDIVNHFMGRGLLGKAMVVSIDKLTALRMYDKVKKYWQKYLAALKAQIPTKQGEELQELQDKIKYMEQTDMAVVISQAQNEIEDMKMKGIDILPHRKRMVHEDLDKKFKDPDDPFRIVFVCAMWMTGFDVPCCSTIYLDKPMRNHTLMQTIARANRVFRDKTNGLIVDYVGVFRDLERALSIYGKDVTGGTDTPIKEKDKIKVALLAAVAETDEFLKGLKVNLNKIMQTQDTFERTKMKDDAVNDILVNDNTKKQYLRFADIVQTIHKSYLPDPLEEQIIEKVYIIRKLADQIRGIAPPVDISEVMDRVEKLLDSSIEGYKVKEVAAGYGEDVYDLSKIDFEKLRKKFEKARKHIEIERLKGLIENKLYELVAANRTRLDFLERFQKLIDEYNAGARNVEEMFNQLIKFAQELNDEAKRFIREGLNSEEELAIFDLLIRPDMKLSKKDEMDVKKVATKLLDKLKTEKFVLDWTKKQQARAGVKLTISEVLDELPEAYTKEVYENKCNQVYLYVYDRY